MTARAAGRIAALASALVDAGVHTVVARRTSRGDSRSNGRPPRDRFDSGARLDAADIPLRLGLAAELSSVAAIDLTAEELRRRRLGQGYVLVELEPDTPSDRSP